MAHPDAPHELQITMTATACRLRVRKAPEDEKLRMRIVWAAQMGSRAP